MTEGDLRMDFQLHPTSERLKNLVANGLNLIEDIVYIGLAVLLAAAAIWLLFLAIWAFAHALIAGVFAGHVVGLLDQILLVLLIIELLYTVVLSFREHSLIAEPFLVVALIADVRKILVLTARIAELPNESEVSFRQGVIELSVLGLLVLVLVASLILLQRYASVRTSHSMPERVPNH
jgi:uncharacterized membrane protein (DUF373 family)